MLDEMNAQHSAGMPPMSAEDMVKRALLGHIDEHFSIRRTVGR